MLFFIIACFLIIIARIGVQLEIITIIIVFKFYIEAYIIIYYYTIIIKSCFITIIFYAHL